MSEDRLLPLKKAKKYRVHRKDTDPRGWELVAADGKTVGKVDDLIVDLRSGHARYISARIDKSVVSVDRPVYVLVPLENARLVPGNKRVFLDGIQSGQFSELPEYGNEPLTREQERFIAERFPPRAGATQERPPASEPAPPPEGREPSEAAPASERPPPPAESSPPPEGPPPGDRGTSSDPLDRGGPA